MTEGLGHILDTIAFKSMRPQQIAKQVADRVESQSSWSWPRSQEDRVKQRVDHLAKRYGNLGVSRRKMTQMVMKLLRRRAARRTYNARKERLKDGDQNA
jgi:hypothetical protein